MSVSEVLESLKKLENKSTFARNLKNGAGENQYGVRLGDIRILAKKLKKLKEPKKNHELALSLWATKNIDAQMLAILLMQADSLSASELEALVESVTFFQVAVWLNAYVAKQHPEKETLRKKWMQSKHPMIARAGWELSADKIAKNPDGLDLSDLSALLDRIAAELGIVDPEIQWTMNFALAAIGIHIPEYRERAIAIGEAVGLYRDWKAPKGCTSPFAPVWIKAIVSKQK